MLVVDTANERDLEPICALDRLVSGNTSRQSMLAAAIQKE